MRELFPAFLDLKGRRVLLVGGGPVAAAKLGPLVDARADVTVVAPDVVPEILESGVTVHRRSFVPDDLEGCWYVVAAAPSEVNAEVQREGQARRIFVNAVDDPAHATAFAGSVVRRGPVTIAISTGGQAPALAKLLREALERILPEALGEWTAIARALRDEWRRDGVPMAERTSDLLNVLVALRSDTTAAVSVSGSASSAPSAALVPSASSVAIVGAGPGDPDLLTRRAAARLADADLVLYDSLVSPDVLALARRARLVHVGRRSGRATATQEQVHDVLIAAARRGERAVRLKGGDPFVFGRGGEDVLALARAGVSSEVVPGVSSAFAGPALAGIPVTHRGKSSAALVVTGHDVARFRALIESLPPADVTLVVLMALDNAPEIARTLTDGGWPALTPAAIVRGASRPEGSVWSGTLADLTSLGVDPDDRELPGLLVIGDVVDVRREVEEALAGSHGLSHSAIPVLAAESAAVMSHG